MPLPTTIQNILNTNIVESVRVEYKKGWNPETIMHTICAFANDIDNFSGGYILIGIDADNGLPVHPICGIKENQIDEIEKKILEYCKKCLSPEYIPVIDHVIYEEKNIIVLWCPAGSERPYKCYEDVFKPKKETRYRTYIRKGSTTIVANDEDEKELYSLSAIQPFDDRVNYHCSISDIDKNLIIKYLQRTGSSLYATSKSIPTDELLDDLKVIGGPSENRHPKNIAILMFTNEPEEYIPYAYIDLAVIDDPTGNGMVEKEFHGPLMNQFDDVMLYIKNNVLESITDKVDGEYESKVTWNYSYEALEEIIANALLHKSYQIGEPVTVRIEPDHIEVTSIPGFDRTISETAIKELKPRSKRYRNRRIAEFFKELRFAEAKNTGYPEIVRRCKDNGSPLPVIDMNVERDYVTVIVPIHERFNKNRQNIRLRDQIINALLLKPMKKTELCRYLGYERIVNSVSRQLNHLIEEGIVEKRDDTYHLK